MNNPTAESESIMALVSIKSFQSIRIPKYVYSCHAWSRAIGSTEVIIKGEFHLLNVMNVLKLNNESDSLVWSYY